MKLVPIAATLAVACLPFSGHAASSSEFEGKVLDQLQQLTERLNKLEQENSQLASDNQALTAENAELKAQEAAQAPRVITSQDVADAVPASTEFQRIADKDKAKSADGGKGIAFKGDLRYRYEYIDEEPRRERERQRIRARFGFAAKATENIAVAVQLATTDRPNPPMGRAAEDNGDPRSSNVTLGDSFSRKRVDIDLAYFDYAFAEGFNLQGGKMPWPFKRPGQSYFFDGDVNPEGLAVGYKGGMWFGNAYGFTLTERSGNSDTLVSGLQFGATIPVGSSDIVAGVHYMDLGAAEGRSPFYNGSPNGNTTVMGNLLANDFQIIELLAEYNTKLGNLPFQVWVDAAQNTDPDDNDTAYGLGAVIGKASDAGTWEVGALYQRIEKDALFGQFIDGDFGAGSTDAKGFVVKAAYAPVRNWVLNATFYLNDNGFDQGADSDYDRLQLDFNLKF